MVHSVNSHSSLRVFSTLFKDRLVSELHSSFLNATSSNILSRTMLIVTYFINRSFLPSSETRLASSCKLFECKSAKKSFVSFYNLGWFFTTHASTMGVVSINCIRRQGEVRTICEVDVKRYGALSCDDGPYSWRSIEDGAFWFLSALRIHSPPLARSCIFCLSSNSLIKLYIISHEINHNPHIYTSLDVK